MGIYLGDSGYLRTLYLGDNKVKTVYEGNTVVYVGNDPPTAHVLSSSVVGTAVANQTVTITSMVTDPDGLTNGIYVFTVDGVAQPPQTHPNNTINLTGAGQTRTVSCVFTDDGGLSITSNTLSIAWDIVVLLTFTFTWPSNFGSASAAAQCLTPLVGVGGSGNSGGWGGTISFQDFSNTGITIPSVSFYSGFNQCFIGCTDIGVSSVSTTNVGNGGSFYASGTFEWVANAGSYVNNASCYPSIGFPSGYRGTATNATPETFSSSGTNPVNCP